MTTITRELVRITMPAPAALVAKILELVDEEYRTAVVEIGEEHGWRFVAVNVTHPPGLGDVLIEAPVVSRRLIDSPQA